MNFVFNTESMGSPCLSVINLEELLIRHNNNIRAILQIPTADDSFGFGVIVTECRPNYEGDQKSPFFAHGLTCYFTGDGFTRRSLAHREALALLADWRFHTLTPACDNCEKIIDAVSGWWKGEA